MPRQTQENQTVRKLGKIGSSKNQSYYVTLPIELVRKFGWRDGQKVVVRQYRGKTKIVIEDWEA